MIGLFRFVIKSEEFSNLIFDGKSNKTHSKIPF